MAWKVSVGNPLESLSTKTHIDQSKWGSELPHGMNEGTLRFKKAKSADQPGEFCWDTDGGGDKPTKSVIYDSFQSTRPYKPAPPEKQPKKKRSVVLFTGTHGAWNNFDNFLYFHLSKMYYAKRHGYKFVIEFSNQLIPFFPPDLYAAVGRPDGYFKGVMSKFLMAMDVMYRFPNEEWMMFTDDDVYFNADWLEMPLDYFLDDVPDDKLWVHTNYRSLMTGLFFVRNNAEGRKLVRDWVAIGMRYIL